MEINDLFGLPAHPLLVHVPVVLVPLAFIGSIFVVARPGWRRAYAVPVAALAVIGGIGVFLAAQSGEQLEERVRENDAVEVHADKGEQAEPFAAVFVVLAVGLAVADQVDRRGRRAADADADGTEVPAGGSGPSGTRTAVARAVPVLAVLSLLSGAAASWAVYDAGHSGAKATWQDTVDRAAIQAQPSDGDDD